ncbi:putative regulator of Vps4 activity in the MVB pathway [Lyophyllum shimeji]|uniref:Regulator of Vps4 activity in the MVB pathway n=1 Tax=Lyophyllum shimeji TaxID=47721 RepID=A0A9P3PGH5_LYOSH|nr:putative regulator of Vps4 activity in the MVB pathway [Lyophyllum shimeji]
MANAEWQPASVKAQLRLTSLRLGQLQERKDSQGAITRRDIASLLQQRDVGLARAKAQILLQDDALGDLLEVLEMQIGQLLEHFNELDQGGPPTPIIIEAASTLIFSAPHVDSKDLAAVSDLLTKRLGSDFAHSARGNYDNPVAPLIVRAVTAPPPSVETLDAKLEKIAKDCGVQWSPEPRREEIFNTISEALDPQGSTVVDMVELRELCSRGIPDEPRWLRPRVWKLLLGILPSLKASWQAEMTKQRESYYDLVGRLLDPFSTSPSSQPHRSSNAKLLEVSKLLSNVPFGLYNHLVNAPESFEACPLDENALDEIRIGSAQNLDLRLSSLQSRETVEPPTTLAPDTRVESQVNGVPDISLSAPDAKLSAGQNGHTTLLSFQSRTTSHAHEKHLSALLRLLYVHASINPGNLSPHVSSLLVALYAVVNHEVLREDLAHAEADTFWLFEAVVGEFSELEDEGGNIWMKRLSERLAWADADLFGNLQVKGLDPALPHYSYRWLAPLLTHTLPLPSVLPVWDALFCCPTRARDVNPKMDRLLDICTAMLIRARAALFRLGKGGRKSPGLWAEDALALPPPSPLRAWELGDAFLEGMSLLQQYPIEAAGGIDRVLQTASDLGRRREEEAKSAQNDMLSLGARIKATMWKGLTNQESTPGTSPEESEEELSDEDLHEDGNDTETPDQSEPGLTSRLATTVWRGITNQTSMEPPPTPLLPPSPSASPSQSSSAREPPESPRDGSATSKSSLWAYADKLRDSDTVATFAKVSSNWRARAMLGSWGRTANSPPGKEAPRPPLSSRSESFTEGYDTKQDERRRGSLPVIDRHGVYSPPPRPPYFRPPRDSFVLPTDATPLTLSPQQDTQNDSSFMDKTRSLSSTFAALTRTSPSQPPAKSGPRPLLLSPSTSITSPPARPISRSAGSSPAPDRGEWTHVMKLKGHSLHRDSQSSISSLSPSDALRSARSSRTDWDSDNGTSGRRVPLNRKSVSPMAPGFKVRQGRRISGSSSATSSDRGLLSPPLSTQTDLQGWSRVDVTQSPPLTSPPPISSAVIGRKNGDSRFVDPSSGDELPQARKLVRKITPPPAQDQTDDTSDSSVVRAPPRSPRLRSRRHPSRPPTLLIEENTPRQKALPKRKLSNPNSLAVEWPTDDQEVAKTPRATSFDVDEVLAPSPTSSRSLRRSRKVSTEAQERRRKTSTDTSETRPRKISSGQRTRKISSEHKEITKRIRESSAEEGDDEGYDDLLSAYESEEGAEVPSVRRSTQL